MDEVLKRRLVGALLLLIAALLLTWLLPKPGELPLGEDDVHRVTLDLAEKAPQVQPALTPIPPVIAASKPAAPEGLPDAGAMTEPEIEESPLPTPVEHAEPATNAATKLQAPPLPPKLKPALALDPHAGEIPPKSVANGRWYIQAGAFSEIANARQLLEGFKSGGFPGLISPAGTKNGTLYRVRIGPFPSRERAIEAQKRVAQAGTSGTALVEE